MSTTICFASKVTRMLDRADGAGSDVAAVAATGYPNRRYVMNRGQSVRRSHAFLHLAYRTGAVVDAAMVVPLLVPRVAAGMLGVDRFAPGADYRYVAGLSAALMAGWAALLVWADHEPIARRGVLLLTVCPVVLGLAGAGGYAMTSGLVRPVHMAPTLIVQLGIVVMFLAAYRRAGALARYAAAGHKLETVLPTEKRSE
jgi:hypothetical protein